MKHILIVYGSQKGSTKEIFQHMHGCLEKAHCTVEVMKAEPQEIELAQ